MLRPTEMTAKGTLPTVKLTISFAARSGFPGYRYKELLSVLGEFLVCVPVSNPSLKFLWETPIILIGSPTWTPYPGWADIFVKVSSVTVPYNSSTRWTQWMKEKRGYEVGSEE